MVYISNGVNHPHPPLHQLLGPFNGQFCARVKARHQPLKQGEVFARPVAAFVVHRFMGIELFECVKHCAFEVGFY